jgi:hypothetical protein
MTTFAEMEALVVGQTRRPEVTAVTQAAIRTATLRAHHTDFFPRDLAPGTLSYTPLSGAQYYDLPDLTTLLPKLRSLQSLKSVDSTGKPIENFEYRELQDLYDSDNVLRTSMYTMIGDTLRVYPQVSTGLLATTYYKNPVVTEAGYSSWVANEYPDELAMWAAAIVFARTGFAEMAQDFQRTHVQPFKELLVASHLFAAVN